MKIIGKIFYGLFVALLIGVAGIFLASLLPIPGKVEFKIVQSGSMEPTIKTGAMVVVKPLAPEAYKGGDIITFGEDSAQEIPTTHRIVSVNTTERGLTFITKGDANEEADQSEVLAREIIGKVIFNAPYIGYVLDFAKQPVGFALLIGVPAAVVIIDESARIWKEVVALRRRKREEKEEMISE